MIAVIAITFLCANTARLYHDLGHHFLSGAYASVAMAGVVALFAEAFGQ